MAQTPNLSSIITELVNRREYLLSCNRKNYKVWPDVIGSFSILRDARMLEDTTKYEARLAVSFEAYDAIRIYEKLHRVHFIDVKSLTDAVDTITHCINWMCENKSYISLVLEQNYNNGYL